MGEWNSRQVPWNVPEGGDTYRLKQLQTHEALINNVLDSNLSAYDKVALIRKIIG